MRSMRALSLAVAGAWLLCVPLDGQAPRTSSAVSTPFRGHRTPWGDSDLQGNYTNKYEQSTPLERPDELAGRRREDVTGAELAAVLWLAELPRRSGRLMMEIPLTGLPAAGPSSFLSSPIVRSSS